MATKLLLIEDVESLGRSGEIVNVKPGYARNFLLPQGFAMIADKKALRQQEKLVEDRMKKAMTDKKESDAIASRVEGVTLVKIVKVDHDGNMYGSVTVHDILDLLKEQEKVELEKKNIALKHPVKEIGISQIQVKLKEGVTAAFTLKVMSEEGFKASQAEQPAAQ